MATNKKQPAPPEEMFDTPEQEQEPVIQPGPEDQLVTAVQNLSEVEARDPEMKGICFIDIWEGAIDKNGEVRYWKWSVTERSSVGGIDAMLNLRGPLLDLVESNPNLSMYPPRDLSISNKSADAQGKRSGAFGGKSAGGNGATQPTTFGGSQAASPATPEGGANPKYVSELRRVTVLPPNEKNQTVVEFMVGNLKWPLKEARGPSVAAGLFAPEVGITAEFLSTPATYTPEHWGQAGFPKLMVETQKNGKYTDILRIFPPE